MVMDFLSFFKNEGSLLCAIDESNDHVLSVWNWQKEKKIAETKVKDGKTNKCVFKKNITDCFEMVKKVWVRVGWQNSVIPNHYDCLIRLG